jgi:hypothetical protein
MHDKNLTFIIYFFALKHLTKSEFTNMHFIHFMINHRVKHKIIINF